MNTPPVDNALHASQCEVQRLLGRCILRLQQYERLIKVIVSHHYVDGPAHALESIRTARIGETATKTLGTLVGNFLESFVVTGEDDTSDEVEGKSPNDAVSFKMRMSVRMSTEDYERTEADLKKLVMLRNNLVHHFSDQHDLWSLDGCRRATDALLEVYSRIGEHFEQLRGWAEDMDQLIKQTLEFIQSDAFFDMVANGIYPDGTVDWSSARVVRLLREAAGYLAADGWTHVAAAGRWITERHPEQLPSKYGCRSWRQVIHMSRLFELRYRDVDGRRAAWYQPRGA